MNPANLASTYPFLFHMAEDGSWPSIRMLGLLSTRALLDAFEISGRERDALVSRRRPQSVQITHPSLGSAVIRDNKPLSDVKLARVLKGMTVEEWYRLLNNHVFFWPTEERLSRLLGARAYREQAHTVLILDTERLVAVAEEGIRLSPINSGSTAYRAVARGRDTLLPLADYPLDERRQSHGVDAVAEVAVVKGIRNVESLVVRVERWLGDEKLGVIWRE